MTKYILVNNLVEVQVKDDKVNLMQNSSLSNTILIAAYEGSHASSIHWDLHRAASENMHRG